jgi:uncharacterized membrane protein
MRLAPLALLAPLTLLAACQPPAAAPDEPTPPASITLGGVDLGQPLRALGTEPFWSVAVTPTELKYDGVDRPLQTATNPGPVVAGTTAVFTAMTDQNNALVVTLIDTDCSDGMSERLYPLTAKVEISGETLSGCAISQAALDAGGEGGGEQAADVQPPAQ